MYRKIMILFLIAMLMASWALAEGGYSGEITFRDYPWGTDVVSICNDMEKQGCMVASTEVCIPLWGTLDQELLYHASYFERDTEEKSGYMVFIQPIYKEMNVAGYNVNSITVYCAYKCNGDVVLKGNNENMLCRAEYFIKTENANKAYEDLKSKISTIYGECVENSKETYGGEAIDRISEWCGSNGTAVRLYGRMANTDVVTRSFSEGIYIFYGDADVDPHLQLVSDLVAKEKADAEESVYGNSDISGL